MGVHPVVWPQDQMSEPPAGQHCVSRVRLSRPTLQIVPLFIGDDRAEADHEIEDGGRLARLDSVVVLPTRGTSPRSSTAPGRSGDR